MSNKENNTKSHPDRLFIAFLEEWNDRHELDALALSAELQEMIQRYLQWSRVMGAEAIIHHLQRTLELSPHPNDNLKFGYIQELIRKADPAQSDIYTTATPRMYNLPEEKIPA